MMMTVNEVSKLAGVSIRTLQYYDKIGLLHPTGYTDAGYRLYDDADLERLQHILLFRELEFPLKDIKMIVNSPDFDRSKALEQQIELLRLKKEHIENLMNFALGIKLLGVKHMDFKAFDRSKLDEYSRQVTVFANRKAWWRCKDCGREWNTLISTRSGGSKCPYCSGYIFLKGFNDLQTTHPEIASEWSEKNLPLKPDEVNAKSRKNIWWKCRKCGNEWKSVINARVKGTVCPVCAEREVLAGYNDLATTDNQLLSEWDYEQNKLKPTEVSRTSAKRAWWKCRHGHSWSMKINERTILKKGCRICEREYLSLFPALAVSYYSNKKGLKAELGSDRLLGVPLETYIPSEKLAIESGSADENIEIMKAYMCEQRGIRLIKLPMKGTELDYADSLKRAFQNVHIFISSDTEEDVEIIKNTFERWRDSQ